MDRITSKQKGKHRVIRNTLLIVIGVALAVVAGASVYMLNYSLGAQHRSRAEALERLAQRTPSVMPWVDSIMATGALHDTTIVYDGKKLHAYYMAADSATNRTAVIVHGYKDTGLSMLQIGYMFHRDLGYNILLPEVSAHGESEGDNIGMGWRERHEVLRWIAIADSMFRDDLPSTTMVLHGISMGGATVMNVSGEQLPSCVKAIIEDCGYTSAWDEFAVQIKDQFGLPQFPLLYSTSALCKVCYGWSFGEDSPVNQVKKCKVPMLFIHGDKDDFVPTAMVHEVYAAHPGPKDLWLAPGSIHARAYSDHPNEYTRRVKQFLDNLR